MGKLKLKHKQLCTAIDRLKEAVDDFRSIQERVEEGDRQYRTYRDSLIQRFEFCTDLFWKYLKRYLEEAARQKIEINAPAPVIRQACKAKLLTEKDAELSLEMIKNRNMSSHIYKEEVADQIGALIPRYFELIQKYAQGLLPPEN